MPLRARHMFNFINYKFRSMRKIQMQIVELKRRIFMQISQINEAFIIPKFAIYIYFSTTTVRYTIYFEMVLLAKVNGYL